MDRVVSSCELTGTGSLASQVADRELAGCELARSRIGLVAGCELARSRAR
ncbi:UNVERIFIED_CONTAM: hypothetical protein Sradi_7136100 [Sesamum radiatum]|uniref:Uncharacterized protein n=1 Tax=Sesamum radiatum TaxID=300843 RepID=A0AAW2IXT5_SESRA